MNAWFIGGPAPASKPIWPTSPTASAVNLASTTCATIWPPVRDKLVQRDLDYAVIDEVDNVLIDEARTPLIISGPADRSGKEYSRFSDYVRRLKRNTAEEDEEPNGHYDLDEKSRSISLTEMGIAEIEKRIPEIDAMQVTVCMIPAFST